MTEETAETAASLPFRIGSLCSGYGGLELGLMAVVGGSVVWHVEYDKHPSAVLEARFPGVPNYGDITTTDWSHVEPVDWLTAGYPCQPFSHAGKRKGSADERHLWPFVAHAIGLLRPGRVLLENVAGHVSLGLDAVLADLAALGYDATWGVVRASDAGAPHARARVFIVAADAAHDGHERGGSTRGRRAGSADPGGHAADAHGTGLQGAESAGGRVLPAWCATADTDVRRRSEGWDALQAGQSDAAGGCRSGTAPADTDGAGGEALSGRPGAGDARRLQPVERGAAPNGDSASDTGRQHNGELPSVDWGRFGPAIRRWEHVLGRPAPAPTERRAGTERLSAAFVEWMQGLPAGWVTDVLPRNPALKALGNGVVPQQAALAVSVLLHNEAVAA